MKTAISLPDDIFDAATRRAAQLGLSRSQFFAVAARHYLDELDSTSVTMLINEALDDAQADDTASVAAAAGRRRIVDAAEW